MKREPTLYPWEMHKFRWSRLFSFTLNFFVISEDGINSSRNADRVVWQTANRTCHSGLLQFPDNVTTTYVLNNLTDQEFVEKNMSYWLGIHKNSSCTTHLIENRENLKDLRLGKCPHYTNLSQRFGNCSDMNHVVCVKTPGNMDAFYFACDVSLFYLKTFKAYIISMYRALLSNSLFSFYLIPHENSYPSNSYNTQRRIQKSHRSEIYSKLKVP